MSTGQLVLVIVIVVGAAVLVALVLRRGAARREEQRVEAAGMRSRAEEVAARASGQTAFAQQAEERADVARAEAEEKARHAERLEAQAGEQRDTAEQTRQEYEGMMRRADDVDPDVKESGFPPVADPDPPMTRAERRRAREEAEARGSDTGGPRDDEGDRDGGPSVGVAGAAGAAAVATAPWAARRGDGASDADEERSARIASASDYRDDVSEPSATATEGHADEGSADAGEGASDTDDRGRVWGSPPVGTETGMSQTPSQHENADLSDDTADPPADAAADAESPQGEWGGPGDPDAPEDDHGTEGASPSDSPGGGVEMVTDTEPYAASEPVFVDEQAAPIEPERPDDAGTGILSRSRGSAGEDDEAASTGGDEAATDDVPAAGPTPDSGTEASDVEEAGTDAVIIVDADPYASTEPVLADGSTAGSAAATGDQVGDDAGATAADRAEEPTEERYDPSPERDWAADEGELLAENRDRGEELAADRASLEQESHESPAAAEDARGRRVSEFHEIRDGGYGVGSAAALDDGAQPLDHPVAGYRDTMTFRSPGAPGYDDADPDVWFYDEGAAERAGFHRSEG